MHASIKIISFLVFGAAVSTGSGQVLLAGLLIVTPLYFFSEKSVLHGAMQMTKRLKWLFVSILVVYLFFTPGQLLLPDILWGPTIDGLFQGLLRIAALVLLVAAVNLLIQTTEQGEFLSAILWCLRPLSLLGISHERLAVRISLTLDGVSQARSDLSQSASTSRDIKGESKLALISGMASRLFESALKNAESTPLREIALPDETRPPVFQWLIPVGLAVLFMLIQYLSIKEWI